MSFNQISPSTILNTHWSAVCHAGMAFLVLRLLKVELAVPEYTTLRRRRRQRAVTLPLH
jgi:hypothetical protein